ncbi:4-coumarate--CoA ligase-like 1 [Ischnura elegans]|uniref:4-coumarate--CoA ligase-like 1 n=1 Tax=Ischnura elegans TaxID=197161 RepID=UPI001ED88DEC|nr:4-coumarate--CoA ligase-like 1 [Ischnura elegans]
MSPVEVGTQVFRSPFAALAEEIVIPDVSYPQFLFQCIRKNMKVLQDRVAVVDAVRDQCLMFKEVEPLAKQFASALTKKGFGKGEVFFYVTYNAALLYALQLGVQLCGGATRGCFQKEESGELEKQMRETKSRFILCEPETAELVKMVSGRLGWPVILFSIDGAVEGATAVEEMAYEDDGSAYDGNVIIDPDEDVLFIASTSGSTGHPKGVLHTHRNMVALLASAGAPIDLERPVFSSESRRQIVPVGHQHFLV